MQDIDFETNSSLKILVSGASGSGKTTLVKTLPKSNKPILYLDFEKGALSIKSVFKSNLIKGISCNKFSDIRKLQKESLYPKYDWIIIDSLSGVSAICEKEIIGQKIKNNTIVSYKDWGSLKVELESFITFFKNIIPNNVLFITRTKNLKNDYEHKDIDYLLPTSIRESIKGDFDIALYLTKVKEERVLITQQSFFDGGDILTAKVRDEKGSISVVEEANLANLIKKL